MRKPTVLTRCVANTYVGRNERIIEVSDRESDGAGCLISITRTPDKKLVISVYRGESDGRVLLRFDGKLTPVPV